MEGKQTIIISSKPGQLGNMLILFSHFIAFGIEKNITIKAPAFEEYGKYFYSTQKAVIPSFPASYSFINNKLLQRITYRVFNLIARIVNKLKLNNPLIAVISLDWSESIILNENILPDSRYLFVMGWIFRSETLVGKHKKIILDFFKPIDKHVSNINKLIPKDLNDVLIGVHIRQGDYKTFEGGKFYFETIQYIHIMNRTTTLFQGKKIRFLICSNGKLNYEEFSDLPYLFGTGEEIEDLCSFAKCDYLIGPPSTFTMWASFYGEVPLYQVHDPADTFTLENFKISRI